VRRDLRTLSALPLPLRAPAPHPVGEAAGTGARRDPPGDRRPPLRRGRDPPDLRPAAFAVPLVRAGCDGAVRPDRVAHAAAAGARRVLTSGSSSPATWS